MVEHYLGTRSHEHVAYQVQQKVLVPHTGEKKYPVVILEEKPINVDGQRHSNTGSDNGDASASLPE